ncbi:MAG: sensor histidine kinase [Anaerolineales bacterium]|nr:sensor histidine kinase [Anaerolineales bacterium]
MKSATTSAVHEKTGKIILFILVAAALISTFVIRPDPFTLYEIVLILVLGVIFTLFGYLDETIFDKFNSNISKTAYFSIQLAIVALILYLSQGNAWLLVLFLTGQSVVYLNRIGILLVNGIILVLFLITFWLLTNEWRTVIQTTIAFSAAIAFVIMFTKIAMDERKSRLEVENLAEQLDAANQKLREYTIKVEELAAFHERNRLAREIHDGLGHYLTTINIHIKAAKALLNQDKKRAEKSLSKALALNQDALNEIRRSVAALRGDQRFNKPLGELFNEMVEEMRVSGLVSDVKIIGNPRQLSPQVEMALFRAAQEGLTNVSKHALASRVDLTLEYEVDLTSLTIQDNGIGSTFAQIETGDEKGGFGLFGLRERIQLLGGSLSIQTSPQEGFKLQVEIPDEFNESDSNTDR